MECAQLQTLYYIYQRPGGIWLFGDLLAAKWLAFEYELSYALGCVGYRY